MVEYILSEGYGYGFTLGLGAAFALLMVFITNLLSKYSPDGGQNSENFVLAGRAVKPGLLSSAVVSSWTWPATLLTSGSWAYSYGVSGAFAYSIAGSLSIILFSLVAIELKRITPAAHTVAEVIKVRFGNAGHAIYLGYVIATNAIVSVMLLLGGAQGFNSACG